MLRYAMHQHLKMRHLIFIICFILGLYWLSTNHIGYHSSRQLLESSNEASVDVMDQVIVTIRRQASRPVVIPGLTIACKPYEELRNINLQDPVIRKFLCRDVEAFVPQADGQFPVCLLSDSRIVRELMRLTSSQSQLTYVKYTGSYRINLYTYKPDEDFSRIINQTHQWESHHVVQLVSMALKIPDATFVDIGCNFGVYSIYATAKNLPTISFDANLRNLLRLRRTMKMNGISQEKVNIIWNYFSKSSDLQYLELLGQVCTFGSNVITGKKVHDNMPIMPITGDALIPFVKSRNIVMKVDIEGGEASFFLSSLKLFDTFNVAVVQMESQFPVKDPKKAKVFEDFFVERKFRPFTYTGLRNVPVKNWTRTGEEDIIWIRKDFVRSLGLEIKFP